MSVWRVGVVAYDQIEEMMVVSGKIRTSGTLMPRVRQTRRGVTSCRLD